MGLHSIELSSVPLLAIAVTSETTLVALVALGLLAAAIVVAWRARSRRVRLLAATGVAVAVASCAALAVYVRFAPLESPYALLPAPGATVIDAHGVVLQRDASDGLRVPVRLQDVSPALVDATIAAEDGRFRSHPGVDPLGIMRALVTFPFHRSGASTLTQQLARRLYLRSGGNPVERKAREMVIALQLESRYSKDQILELYLNDVYYGRGAYGVEAAARVYFGVSARNLDLAQSAFLAGLPQLPAVYGAEPDAAMVSLRRAYVLQRLLADGRVSPAEASAAASEPLILLPSQPPEVGRHFVSYALSELQRLRPDLASRPGITVQTTLDAGLQAESERLVRDNLSQLKDRNVGNAAVVVQDPSTGALLTMVGSADFADADGGQVNMALAARQPGSALKPFLYAAALEHGYTAASPLLDVPTTFQTPTGPYTPLDFDQRFQGVVPLRVALASSLNVPAVATLDALGVDTLLDEAHRFGLSTLTDSEVYGLALTLGGGEVRLLDLTNAYAALANGGTLPQPYAVERVLDAQGSVLYQHEAPQQTRVVSPEEAFVLSDMLSDAVARQPGFGDAPALSLPFPAAVKTGTTSEFHDNWALGYTPQRVVGVWAGNADNTAMNDVSGVDGAGPIWRAVMLQAMQGLTPAWPQPPADLVRATVCTPTGLAPGPDCPSPAEEWFLPGTEPARQETYFSRDASGRLVIDPPAAARAWAIAAGLQLKDDAASDGQVLVVQPAAGTVLFLAPELPSQQYTLRASVPTGAGSVEFRIDGALAGTAPADDPSLVWALSPGKHRLEVSAALPDGSSTSATSDFEVRP